MLIIKRSRRPLWAHVAVLLVLVLLSLPNVSVAFAQDVTKLVFFGDSLSDPGNYFVAFGTIAQQPFVPIPDAPYAIGGHHFSNGATWAEQLAGKLHLPTSGSPALRTPGVFTNYAVGRARARAGAPVFPQYDLSTQVSFFLSDFGGQAPSDSLYVVWIGANDLDDALNALASDPSGGTSGVIIQAAINAVAANIYALWSYGGRTFLIPNVPNLALTPAVRALAPGAQGAATQLTIAYNGALDQVLSDLHAGLGIKVVRLDVNALFGAVLAAPETFGLADVEDPCLTFFVTGSATCATPNQYLFWDGIHPTTTGHDLIARAALQALTAP